MTEIDCTDSRKLANAASEILVTRPPAAVFRIPLNDIDAAVTRNAFALYGQRLLTDQGWQDLLAKGKAGKTMTLSGWHVQATRTTIDDRPYVALVIGVDENATSDTLRRIRARQEQRDRATRGHVNGRLTPGWIRTASSLLRWYMVAALATLVVTACLLAYDMGPAILAYWLRKGLTSGQVAFLLLQPLPLAYVCAAIANNIRRGGILEELSTTRLVGAAVAGFAPPLMICLLDHSVSRPWLGLTIRGVIGGQVISAFLAHYLIWNAIAMSEGRVVGGINLDGEFEAAIIPRGCREGEYMTTIGVNGGTVSVQVPAQKET